MPPKTSTDNGENLSDFHLNANIIDHKLADRETDVWLRALTLTPAATRNVPQLAERS